MMSVMFNLRFMKQLFIILHLQARRISSMIFLRTPAIYSFMFVMPGDSQETTFKKRMIKIKASEAEISPKALEPTFPTMQLNSIFYSVCNQAATFMAVK